MAYKITVNCNNSEYSAEGETIFDALNNLPLSFTDVKTKGSLRLKQGRKEVERNMTLAQLRPLVNSKFRKILIAKQLGEMLQAKA